VKTNPSRSTVSPTLTSIDRLNIGPADAKVWNSPFSPHGSIPRAGYKPRPHEEQLAQLSSSDTPVVVMEPTEYGDGVDAAVRLEWTWNRLLVREGLVRTRFVVEADVLGNDAPAGDSH
jgi:hypothetical protein